MENFEIKDPTASRIKTKDDLDGVRGNISLVLEAYDSGLPGMLNVAIAALLDENKKDN